MISSFQFFYVLIGKEGVARKLILLFQLSWINQESVICGSQHFFHPAEEDLPKSVLPGVLFYILGGFGFPKFKRSHLSGRNSSDQNLSGGHYSGREN